MGTAERSKKKVLLYKKAIVHFLLCFVMGFFTGFAPTGKSSIFSTSPPVLPSNRSAFSPVQPGELLLEERTEESGKFNRKLDESEEGENSLEEEEKEEEKREDLIPRRLIILVTPTRMNDRLREVNIRRLSNTLRLVPPPFLWVVVEQKSDSSEVSEILRKTGIMYRHLVFHKNFTDPEVEMDHQRNLALNHIEHHRLSGIVHFAGLSNVYDLQFFDEIRAIEVFGTWPMAIVSANRKKVIIEGPVCDSSEVVGWHLRKMSNLTETKSSPVHISSFAFNSSVLWDPERWGRLSSVQGTTQNTIKFVKKEVLEEETKLIGIPPEGCSKIMLWNVQIAPGTTPNSTLPGTPPDGTDQR
ncbi:hypothetical protein RHSIM_RhsimUnG0115900 [Rhododendron simsii]|uniref:Glycosyltransferases n=1 Tax=Rhododendron simsii TaxID=118357 RepID=A0A834G148_RHOSS|nr:hypothetical protein RHSIM_RhsimUnG0115900 [Rhododendron simsii]